MKEVKKFKIKLWIKDKKTSEIIGLEKIDDLEIQWRGKWGRAEKKVNFAKNGKVYLILVRVELVKYLFGTRDTTGRSAFFSLSPDDYEIYRGYEGEPNNSPEKDEERWDEEVRIINEWRDGRIAFFSLIIVIVIFAIFILILWIKKK